MADLLPLARPWCHWTARYNSVRELTVKGILPAIGGLALLGAFVLSIKSYWPAASSYSSFHGVGGIFLIGAGSLLVGAILMIVTRLAMPGFFTAGTLPPLADQGPPAVGLARAGEVAA